jgi:hypothetical protein
MSKKTKNNKKATSKTISKTTVKTTVSKKPLTVNGVQLLPSGSYRVRKSIKGIKFDVTFKKRRDAVALVKTLTN